MHIQKSSRSLTVTTLALALMAQGCSDSPSGATLDDLTAQFKVQMAANPAAGGSAMGSVAGAARQSGKFKQEPSENQFNVLGPNVNVFRWPIIQDTPINARWGGNDTGETMVLEWPCSAFPQNVWPDLDVAGGTRYGNTWVVYPAGGNPNDWIAQHTEWVRRPGEQCGTNFPFEVKLLASRPCDDCPIGQFVAGPSRHVTDQPAFRRRTVIKWFRYGDQSRWVWPQGSPQPDADPVLQEAHVFIQKFSTTTENGTLISFDNVNQDVDLMTLRGQAIDLVDAQIPRGTLSHIDFNIDTNQSFVVVDGEQRTLNFGTGTVRVDGPIVVGPGPITTVKLEFQVEESMSENSDGTWTMAPIVVITVTAG